MDNRIPGLIFGAALLIVGGFMLRVQQKAAKSLDDPGLSPGERRFMRKRHGRRTQVAGLFLLVGVMIPAGDSLIDWREAPATFAIFCMIILAIAAWAGLLAVGDMLATQAHSAIEMSVLRHKQHELEKTAELLRKKHRGEAD